LITLTKKIGQYSLYSAKIGRDVITVEPFPDNIQRFHKAVVYEHLENKICLIANALSDNRGEIKLLHKLAPVNIGAQGLKYDNETINFTKSEMNENKYLVKTILLDDIVPFLPLRPNKKYNYRDSYRI
jgi:FkbM family methyltransferase